MKWCEKRTIKESLIVQNAENKAKVKYDILMSYLKIEEEKE